MSISFYGMPMLPTSFGVQTLFNLISQGNSGGEAIILDPDISKKMYQMADVEESKYIELSKLARSELDVKAPDNADVTSSLTIVGNWVNGACSALVEFIGDVVEFAFDLVSTVVEKGASGVSKTLSGLFKGAGPILFIGVGLAFFFILK